MASLLEILEKSTLFLQEKGVPEARFDSECLMANLLGMERMALYLNFDRPLTDDEIKNLRAAVLKRSQRIPLQHIVGSVGFRNIDLKVDGRALIPRPDTEGIVDHALRLLKDKVEPSILEIGTGTGAILLSLCDEFPQGKYTATDISREALTLAFENAKALNFQEKVKWIQSDLFNKVEGPFDLIVSNPPYISAQVVAKLEPEVKNFDPALALVGGGDDGLDCIRKLVQQAPDHLKSHGHLLIEHGYDQRKQIAEIPTPEGFEYIETFKDYGDQDRFSLWQKN